MGLAGGTALVVGGVIGMGSFVLIPPIVMQAGTASWLAMSIALVVSLVSVLPLIQMSSALPVAGGGYMYASRLISPLAGTVTSFWAILGGASSLCLISIGLVESFSEYAPFPSSTQLSAIALIAAFYFFYLFGLTLLSNLQIIMSVQLLLALLLYCGTMLYTGNFSSQIELPQSPSFFLSVILCTNLCLGFQIIIEMGEEIHHPEKNIPRSLLIGAGIILIIYLAVLFSYTGIVGIGNLAQKPKLIDTAKPFLSSPFIWFLQLGMISAGLTSYNGGAIALPREIFSMSRDKTLPAFLSRTNKQGSPITAVTLFFTIVIAELLVGQCLQATGIIAHFFGNDIIEFYGFMTIMGIMLLTISISISAYYLPKKFNKQYQQSHFKFSWPLLLFFIIVSILFSLFLIVIIATKWIIPVVYLLFTAGVMLFFMLRKQYLLKQGIEVGAHYTASGWQL